ncbi:MAG: EAL domain-containing protein [Paracoccaceae bacterium]
MTASSTIERRKPRRRRDASAAAAGPTIALGYLPILRSDGSPAFREVFPARQQCVRGSGLLAAVLDRLSARPELRLSVDLTPADLEDMELLAALAHRLDERPETAERLILEVPEAAMMADPVRTRRRLARLRALGVAIAIDGFASLQGSLRDLIGLRLDLIKIHPSFVRAIEINPDNRSFLGLVARIGEHAGIVTVCGGIEAVAEAEILTGLGIDLIQPRMRPTRPDAARAEIGPFASGAGDPLASAAFG